MRLIRLMAVVLGVALAAVSPARAQDAAPWPSKPLKIIVPYAAGGAADLMARLIGTQLGERLAQPVVVENRLGAGGTIGADAVAKATPDGYTLLFTPNGPFVVNPFLMKKLPYDARTAFAPVSLVAEAPNVLAVSPSFPAKTLRELVEYARKNPAQATYATQGIGTTGHITGKMFERQIGVPLTHVAYKGFPGMYTDLVSGRVSMIITDTFNVVPRVQSKEMVALAVAGKTRSSVLPDVPTFAEAGFGDVVAGPWFSMVAPAGTPAPVRQRLAAEIREILKIPAVAARFKDFGTDVRGLGPEEFGKFYAAEYQRWGDVIRASGIRLDE